MAKQLFRNYLLYGAGFFVAAIAIGLWLGYATALRNQPQIKGQTENSDTNQKDQALSSPNKVESEANANTEILDTNILFYKALTLGNQAASITRYTKTPNGWLDVSSKWQQAITVLQLVPPDHSQYGEAQKKIREYRRNLAYSNKRLETLVPDLKNKLLPRAITAVGVPSLTNVGLIQSASTAVGTGNSSSRVPAPTEMPVPPMSSQLPVIKTNSFNGNAPEVSSLSRELDSNKKIKEAFVDYQVWALEHRKNTFQWGLHSSIAIFILVIAIVVFGLFLSYLQFRKGQISETKFSLGKGSIEISSAVIGFLILGLSLAFFYLYLQHVYPIQEIGGTTSSTASNEDNASKSSPSEK